MTHPHDENEELWLTDEQQRLWRSILAFNRLLPFELNRQLQTSHQLSFNDYDILVHLSEAPGYRLRMSQLAEATLSSRSQLSHQIRRLEERGLIQRQLCTTDRRGSFAELTKAGLDCIVQAAPKHVAGVRDLIVNTLTQDEFDTLGVICRKMVSHLEQVTDLDRAPSATADSA